jgi:hypothetical protein|nr:MAG TPA: hypothetical protein [Caudoviricetes sp.]
MVINRREVQDEIVTRMPQVEAWHIIEKLITKVILSGA